MGGTYDDDVAGADDEGVDVPRPGPAWGGPHGLGRAGATQESRMAHTVRRTRRRYVREDSRRNEPMKEECHEASINNIKWINHTRTYRYIVNNYVQPSYTFPDALKPARCRCEFSSAPSPPSWLAGTHANSPSTFPAGIIVANIKYSTLAQFFMSSLFPQHTQNTHSVISINVGALGVTTPQLRRIFPNHLREMRVSRVC